MIRFFADEDFNGRIVRGLLRRKRELDLVRVQSVGLAGAGDEIILQWAEETGRVVISHDTRTMPRHFRDRLAAGLHVPGVFIVDDFASIGACIDDLVLVAECSDPDEWRDQIFYLPWK
ncbi:MAG: DUF5615 family PIN-like protein [Pirellulales bacterium]